MDKTNNESVKFKLIGSYTSPYVRKLRMLLISLNRDFEFKSINYLEEHDSNFLKKINPINKIPLLIVNKNDQNEEVIFDSRVIFNFISKQEKLSPLSLKEENILSAIDGAMDTSINLFSLRRGGLDLEGGNSYIERQKERVELILDYLNPYLLGLNPNQVSDWNFVSMSLYAYLYWGQFRNIVDLSKRPDCQKFLNEFKNHPGVNETTPPV